MKISMYTFIKPKEMSWKVVGLTTNLSGMLIKSMNFGSFKTLVSLPTLNHPNPVVWVAYH